MSNLDRLLNGPYQRIERFTYDLRRIASEYRQFSRNLGFELRALAVIPLDDRDGWSGRLQLIGRELIRLKLGNLPKERATGGITVSAPKQVFARQIVWSLLKCGVASNDGRMFAMLPFLANADLAGVIRERVLAEVIDDCLREADRVATLEGHEKLLLLLEPMEVTARELMEWLTAGRAPGLAHEDRVTLCDWAFSIVDAHAGRQYQDVVKLNRGEWARPCDTEPAGTYPFTPW